MCGDKIQVRLSEVEKGPFLLHSLYFLKICFKNPKLNFNIIINNILMNYDVIIVIYKNCLGFYLKIICDTL